MKTTKKPFVMEPKVSDPSIHIVDVNMAIAKKKVIEQQVFKDKKPIKNFFVVGQEDKQKLQQYFVKTIQEMQVKNPPKNLNQTEKTQWSTSWAGLPEVEVSTKPIVPQNLSAIFNNKIMYMEHIFQDISKQMLETTYTLRLD